MPSQDARLADDLVAFPLGAASRSRAVPKWLKLTRLNSGLKVEPSSTPFLPSAIGRTAGRHRTAAIYSTVTLFARFRGLSTSQPRSTAQ